MLACTSFILELGPCLFFIVREEKRTRAQRVREGENEQKMKREGDGWNQAGVALIASRCLVARLLGWHFAWMCACSPPASFDAGMLVFSSALLCLQRPGDCGNRTRERDMHSSRIWPLGLGAWLCVRQVSWRGDRAPGWRAGRSDGSCYFGCLGCIDVGMRVCLPALSA